jgi:serine protease DegQ
MQPTSRRLRVIAPLVALVLLAGCGSSKGASGSPGTGASTAPSPAVSAAASAPAGSNGGTTGAGGQGDFGQIPAIVAQVEPSVVSVIQTNGQGSGVVWSADGMIVTNNHVVEGVDQVVVAFADGTRVDGNVVATDALSDLAVVKTNRNNLPAATFATQLPPVGSLAIAIGNPLGFENTVTAGIVSGTGRAIPGAAQDAPALVDLVQTDAAISPGNSGGALVGGDGRIIGVNVAYIPPSGGAVSIGFAIPAPTVRDVVTQLIEKGRAQHAYLGVQPEPLTPQIASEFGLSVQTGALIVEVVPNGPAGKAGVKAGDVIVSVDGTPITTSEDLLGALRRHAPGDKVTLRIARGGDQLDQQVTLGDFPT